MAGSTCDCCGKPSVTVCCSAVGAASFAYCAECHEKMAEPLSCFVYLYDDVSTNGEGLAEHVNQLCTVIDGKYVTWPEYVKMRREAQSN